MREFRLLDEDPDIQEERHNPFANIYQPHYIRHPEHGEVFYYEPIFYYSTVIEIARQSALVALNLFRGFVADKPSEDDIFYFLACPVLIYFFAMEWIMRRWTDGFEKDIREKARAAADRDAQKPVQEEEETAGADGAGKEESADQEAEKPFAQNEQTTSADNALGEEEGAAPTSILRFRESKGTVA
ncbi:MAG: hypothetical protein LQ342_006214 [Letrouitia transgressa]|nr:MAG: hypothetical protein LQ342_006214 [Letrouitia transgressa]